MRLVTTALLSLLYWLIAIPIVVALSGMVDCNADGCGLTNGLVPLTMIAVAIGGFVFMLILRREARY